MRRTHSILSFVANGPCVLRMRGFAIAESFASNRARCTEPLLQRFVAHSLVSHRRTAALGNPKAAHSFLQRLANPARCTFVVARDPTTVLRVIAQGSRSTPVSGVPVGYSMPAFPVLTNDELAAVATYIRSAWGNKAGAVSVAQAAAVAHR
jgi:hypothetical protein